jgi:hypothetical protein
MKRRRNRQLALQRVNLGILGTLITAAAVVGLLITSGTVRRLTDWVDGSAPLLNDAIDNSLESDAVWFQIGALAIGVLLVALGAMWLRRQIPPLRHQQSHDLPNTSDETPGTNIVDGAALAGALAADLERHPAIDRAVVEVRSDDNLVRLQIAAADTLPLAELHSSVITPAVQRASTVGEFDQQLTTQTDVRFIEPERSIA